MKVLRAYPRRIKRPRSSIQVKRSKSFRICCTFWKESMNNSERDEWQSWGNPENISFNNFLSCNMVRVFNDLSPLATPPREV